MLYHPTKLNQEVETRRRGIRRRNEANPQLAPMELPESKALTIIVANKEGEEQARAQGFVRTPPMIKADEDVQVFDPLSNAEVLDNANRKRK